MAKVRQLPDPSDFDLRLLRVFEAVVRAGSFTAAEVGLNKSKSAISMDISALETRLGLKLCRRGRGGFALTPHGKEIYELTLDLFKRLHEFRDRVGHVASRLGGQFTAAMDDNFPIAAQNELSQAIGEFNSANPDVFLSLRTTSPEHVVQLVLEGSAEVGITAVPRHVPELMTSPLFEETMMLFCGQRHPLFHQSDSQIDTNVIATYPCVDVVARQSSRASMVMEQMRIRARAGTIHSRVLFLLSGNFLGFLPSEFARDLIDRGQIRALLVNELSYKNTCYAITRRDAPASGARDRFLAELKRVFSVKDSIPSIAPMEASSGGIKKRVVRGRGRNRKRRPSRMRASH